MNRKELTKSGIYDDFKLKNTFGFHDLYTNISALLYQYPLVYFRYAMKSLPVKQWAPK